MNIIMLQSQFSLFGKLVQPVSEVWGFHSALDVERLLLQFCISVLHGKRSTANDFIYGQLERFPIQFTSKIRILKYWINIITRKSNLLVKRAFDIEYGMCEK